MKLFSIEEEIIKVFRGGEIRKKSRRACCIGLRFLQV